MDIRDGITGSILGMAVGDALGAPVEGAKPGAIRNACKQLTDYIDSEKILGRNKLYRWRKPGLYTDDSQQALVVLDSLLQDRSLRPEKIADRFAGLARGAEFRYGVYRGAGRNFTYAVTEMRQGKSWKETGRDDPGNGAAARVVPIALYFYDKPDEMADAAMRAALMTHTNPVGVSAACGVAWLVARCLKLNGEDSARRVDLISGAADFCSESERVFAKRYGDLACDGYEESLSLFSNALAGLAERFDDPPDRVSKWISENANAHVYYNVTRPTLNFALASVVYAIYLAATHAGDYREALVAVVNSGGDASAIGAVVGAALGALHGVDGIPDQWLSKLANRKQLKARAEALSIRKWKKSKLDDLYKMELGLTRREHEERLSRMSKAGVEFPDKKKSRKLSEPEPIKEKFDAKRFKRQQRRMKKFQQMLPPDEY